MAEKEEGLCNTCSKEMELFWIKQFDKCVTCAENSADELYVKLITSFSIEQMALFEEYNKAKELVRSMKVLDY